MTASHGSVNKRTWTYKGKKRTAYAYCFTYEGKNGETLRARGQAPTRDEALAAMTARKAEQEREALEVSTPATAVTLGEYAEKWLETTKTIVAQRTWRNYTWSLGKHILPTLGASALPAVTRGDVKRLLDDKRAAGLGKNSVRLVRAALSALLADAVDGEVITVN